MPTQWYTAGYLGHKIEELQAEREELGALIVDVRIRPMSRLPMWRQAAMKRTFGEDYVWCEAWGSPDFKLGPPHTLLDADAGYEQIAPLPRPVILLCACRDEHTCHRKVLSDWLREKHKVETTELEW